MSELGVIHDELKIMNGRLSSLEATMESHEEHDREWRNANKEWREEHNKSAVQWRIDVQKLLEARDLLSEQKSESNYQMVKQALNVFDQDRCSAHGEKISVVEASVLSTNRNIRLWFLVLAGVTSIVGLLIKYG